MAYAWKSGHVSSLQKLSEKSLLKGLGEVACDVSSTFCCGGTLEISEAVRIGYGCGKDSSLSEIKLPGATETDLSKLIKASSIASFGKGTEQVIDTSYRNAFKLDNDDFMTSFHLSSTTIMNEIESLMLPNRCIRAEMHKLNIYCDGGHFKSHVDTPRSKEMFGSLVVCLPTPFSGGTLVTRHRGCRVEFDWSSKIDSPNIVIKWAAFFCDVEHEILPVTRGHRFTLTYNLYSASERLPQIPSGNPFYQLLEKAVKTPHFLRNGGCLGFQCQFLYAFSELSDDDLHQMLPFLLKGPDYMVFSVARSIGLKVRVQPVVDGSRHWHLLPGFSHPFGTYSSWEEDEASLKLELGALGLYDDFPFISPQAVIWCSSPDQNFTPAAAYTYYGNEAADVGVCYQAAVLLVDVPPWGDRKCEIDTDTGAVKLNVSKNWKGTVKQQGERVITWRKEGIHSDFSASEDEYDWDDDDDMNDLDDEDIDDEGEDM